jgi:DNA-binding NarL/FixJ family response regulator
MTAVNKVLAGDQYVSSALKRKLSNNLIEEEFSYHLSPREKDVLRLVCSGRIIKEVAEDLGLSTHTVQSYHKNILQKFNVKRTTDLVRIAIQLGFYNPDDN